MRVIYVDMDDVLCNYAKAHQQALLNFPTMIYPQSQYGFFSNLDPMDGAIESFNNLLAAPNVEPYILTAPSIENPLCYTEKRVWIEKHFGIEVTSKLIICANKGLLRGDILIDDWIHGRGQENFIGELIEFGSTSFPSWSFINEYLELD